MTRRFLLTLVCAAGLLSAQDLTLDQLLQKHYAAMGGMEAMKAVQTLMATGKAVAMGGQLELPMVLKAKRPNMVRQEMSLQGRSIISCYDGTTAWTVNPMAGGEPTKMGETEAAQLADSADLDGALVDYKAKGHTIEMLGKEDVEGSPAYKLKITRKSGRTETMWLDATRFLPVKTFAKVSQMGQEMEVESFTSNYKAVNGVMLPFTMEQKMGGNTLVTLTFESYVVNKDIPDSDFKMPAPAPAEKKQ